MATDSAHGRWGKEGQKFKARSGHVNVQTHEAKAEVLPFKASLGHRVNSRKAWATA